MRTEKACFTNHLRNNLSHQKYPACIDRGVIGSEAEGLKLFSPAGGTGGCLSPLLGSRVKTLVGVKGAKPPRKFEI